MKTLPRRNATMLLLSLLSALFALSALVANPHGAAAAAARSRPPRAAFTLSPTNQTSVVVPGQTYVYYYAVTNNSKQPIKVQIAAKNAAGWTIAGSGQDATVPAGTKAEFKLEVEVPADLSATPGSNLVTIGAGGPAGSAISYLTLQWGEVEIKLP